MATMKKGELAVLTCKSEYAYGESGSPPKIPPSATLVFEVELFDWRGELHTGSFFLQPANTFLHKKWIDRTDRKQHVSEKWAIPS